MAYIINYLDETLMIAAIGQATVGLLNLNLNRIMQWQAEVKAMPLLIREVFEVHKWFVTITLWIFAWVTFSFADRFISGEDPLARTLAGGITVFWGIRTYIQVGYYSASHWKGIPSRTAVHIILFIAYGCLTVGYGFCALGGLRLLGGME